MDNSNKHQLVADIIDSISSAVELPLKDYLEVKSVILMEVSMYSIETQRLIEIAFNAIDSLRITKEKCSGRRQPKSEHIVQ